MHGYKAHVATDQDAVLIRGVEVTTANVHDAAELDAILPEAPGDTYGDTAYSGSKPEAAIRARGGTARVVQTGTWGGAEALARLRAHNAEVRHVRARIEGVRHSQALLRPAPDALARAGQGRPAGPAYGGSLQPAPELASARGRASVNDARSLSASGQVSRNSVGQ